MEVFRETINYKHVMLYESNATKIVFVQDKNDRMMDDIGIISTGELKTLSDETETMIKEGIKEVKEMTIEKYAETR